MRVSEQPVLYRRKPRPASDGGRGWLFWLFVLGLPAVVLLYIGMAAGFGYFYLTNSTDLPVGQAEWDVVVDAQDVAQWLPELEVSSMAEELRRSRYIDRSHEVSYEYSPEDASIYISSSLSIERKLTDAVTVYLPLWAATIAGFKLSGSDGLTVETLEDFYEWGDQSKIGLIRNHGEPNGHLFVGRQRNRVVFVLLSGVYFDDPELWAEFIGPTLAHVSAYRPDY